jgi:hypothetical protein
MKMPKKFDSPKEKRTYQCWADMRNRCNNEKYERYFDYGGRGIKVCKRWDSFENFLEDMGLKPEGLVMGRKNVDGNYSASNCEWVTYRASNKNQRRCTTYTYKGRSQAIEEWADEYGMPRTTLSNRVHVYKWPIGLALEAPLRHRENVPTDPNKAKFLPSLDGKIADEIRKLHYDEGHSQAELGRWFGVSSTSIWRIINNLSYQE